MIRDNAALGSLAARVAHAQAVALDTEFHNERHFFPRLMLVQLRLDDDEPVLVDGLAPLDWHPLCDALARVRLLVHGGQSDIAILNRLGGLRPGRIFDTQVAAGCAGDGYPVRLGELVRRYLGVALDKTETLSDWSRRPLSPDQLRYAREDVLLLPDLVRALEDRLASQDNAGIAEACTAEIYERTLETPNPDQAWRSVAGVHLLDGTERAVLRALVTWRDARARDLDMPRPNVASDAALFELARRQPATTDELKANRRTPSTLWKRDGEAVLACITEGRAAEPPPPALPRTRVWLDCVRAAARVAEGHRGVASELSLDARTLERIATGASVEGWREEALGPGFTAFLEGRASIVMPGIFVRF